MRKSGYEWEERKNKPHHIEDRPANHQAIDNRKIILNINFKIWIYPPIKRGGHLRAVRSHKSTNNRIYMYNVNNRARLTKSKDRKIDMLGKKNHTIFSYHPPTMQSMIEKILHDQVIEYITPLTTAFISWFFN